MSRAFNFCCSSEWKKVFESKISIFNLRFLFLMFLVYLLCLVSWETLVVSCLLALTSGQVEVSCLAGTFWDWVELELEVLGVELVVFNVARKCRREKKIKKRKNDGVFNKVCHSKRGQEKLDWNLKGGSLIDATHGYISSSLH